MKFILSSIMALAIAGLPLRVQEPDDKSKPRQEEPKKKPPEPKPREQPDDKPKSKPEKPPKQEPQQPPQQPPDEKQREKQQKEQGKQPKEPSKTDRKSRQQAERPDNTRPGPAKGQHIPPEKFRSSFGREHPFRVARSGGDDRRFRYSGYWFEVVEVWPAGWSFDDDCYVEEDGEDYYLVDVVHPELRVLVIVVSG